MCLGAAQSQQMSGRRWCARIAHRSTLRWRPQYRWRARLKPAGCQAAQAVRLLLTSPVRSRGPFDSRMEVRAGGQGRRGEYTHQGGCPDQGDLHRVHPMRGSDLLHQVTACNTSQLASCHGSGKDSAAIDSDESPALDPRGAAPPSVRLGHDRRDRSSRIRSTSAVILDSTEPMPVASLTRSVEQRRQSRRLRVKCRATGPTSAVSKTSGDCEARRRKYGHAKSRDRKCRDAKA
jgi:hypothetical protein